MAELVKLILSLSLSGTVMILLLFLLRPLYKNRLSKRWQYYIWLIVVLRLLIPVTPRSSLIGNLFYQAEAAEAILLPRPLSTQNSSLQESFPFQGSTGPEHSITDPTTAQNNTDSVKQTIQNTASKKETDLPDRSTAESMSANANQISRTLITLWLFTALLLFVHKITVYQSFLKYVNAGSKPIEDINLLEQFGHIMEQQNIKGSVDLHHNNLVSSPLLIGFFHPRIVLPDVNLSETAFYYTILHELTHYRRLDIFYKWLVQLTLCLHWFNPFVYLMGREVNRLCELSCDERVMMPLSENSRKAYGDTLLNAVGRCGSYKDSLSAIALQESKELLKERLNAILHYKNLSKTVRYASILFTGILIGSAAVLGAYAAPTGKSVPSTSLAADTPLDSGRETAKHNSSGDSSSSDHMNDSSSADAASVAASQPNYQIAREDTIYYIYVDGAGETDKPLSLVTEGFYKLVFVHKDRYSTFGAYREKDMTGLVRHVESMCRTMLENQKITQEDMDLYLSAAEDIQDSWASKDMPVTAHNSNVRHVYYQHPYIIWLGYNLPASSWDSYSGTQITLTDGNPIQVFFHQTCTQFQADEKALAAVTAATERALAQLDDYSSVDSITIVNMEYTGDTDLPSLAKKYYREENLLQFSAVFHELDSPAQIQYLDQMFEEENIAFFYCCIGELVADGAQIDAVERYAMRAYQKDDISFFALLTGMMDAKSQVKWQERCRKDNNTNYLSLFDKQEDFEGWNDLGDWDDIVEELCSLGGLGGLDALNSLDDLDRLDTFDPLDHYTDPDSDVKDLDDYYLSDYLKNRGLLQEYNENGIVTIKNDYYYQNARVRILMDVRPDDSFENFDYNDQGTVDLRLIRDNGNKITRIEYLPAEEASKIIDDLYDTLSDTADENITPRRSTSSTPVPSILSDPAVVDLNRVTRAEVSSKVRNALDNCEEGKWYVIESDGCQYIYCNGLSSHNYAYEPQIIVNESGDLVTININIVDLKTDTPLLSKMRSAGNYILFAFSYALPDPDAEYELHIQYNHVPVTYAKSQA